MPPEALSGGDIKNSPALDVWAVGLIAYQLFTRTFPFEGEKKLELKESILNQEVAFPESANVEPEAQNLILSMLDKSPKTRVQLIDILKNKWLFPYLQEEEDDDDEDDTLKYMENDEGNENETEDNTKTANENKEEIHIESNK